MCAECGIPKPDKDSAYYNGQEETKTISFLVKVRVAEITQSEMHQAMGGIMAADNVMSVVPVLDDATMAEMIQGGGK